jgi:hypothetical protein
MSSAGSHSSIAKLELSGCDGGFPSTDSDLLLVRAKPNLRTLLLDKRQGCVGGFDAVLSSVKYRTLD